MKKVEDIRELQDGMSVLVTLCGVRCRGKIYVDGEKVYVLHNNRNPKARGCTPDISMNGPYRYGWRLDIEDLREGDVSVAILPESGSKPEDRPPAASAAAPMVQGALMIPDPKTGGVKGKKLARYSLLPWDAIEVIAEHFGKCGGDGTPGTEKYPDRNWEKGYDWALSFDAAKRHLKKFWQDREDIDKDSKSLHLTAHAWHALVLLAMYLRGIGTDTRPKKAKGPDNE